MEMGHAGAAVILALAAIPGERVWYEGLAPLHYVERLLVEGRVRANKPNVPEERAAEGY